MRFKIIILLCLCLSVTAFAGKFSLFHWEDEPEYKGFVIFSGGYTMYSGNQEWWSALKSRTELDESDFSNFNFRAAYWMCNDKRSSFFNLNIDYTTLRKSTAYQRSFLQEMGIPDTISVDVDINQTILSLNLSLAARPVHHSFLEILMGLGGGFSFWKLGIAELQHDADYEISDYSYSSDFDIKPNFYPFITLVLYKQIFLEARYTFLRTEEKIWDTDLSFDNLNVSLGFLVFKL